MLRTARIAALSLALLPAFAAADDSVVPPTTCTRPVLPDASKPLSKPAADKLNAEVAAYQTCASSYITERRAIADQHKAIATAHGNAANVFVTGFNAYAAELEAFSKAQAARAKANAAESGDSGSKY